MLSRWGPLRQITNREHAEAYVEMHPLRIEGVVE